MKRWGSTAWVVMLLLSGCAQARSEHEAQIDFHAMTAEAFFAQEAVEQPLEAQAVDGALLAAAIFHRTNQVRAEHDLPRLEHDARLDEAADMQARSMCEHGYVGHENTHDPGRRWPLDRVLETGYQPRAVSENVAQVFRQHYEPPRLYYKVQNPALPGRTLFSYTPDGDSPIPLHTYASFARFVVEEWMNSPGHRENILRPESEALGMSVRFRNQTDDLDEAYCAQVFATPRPPTP